MLPFTTYTIPERPAIETPPVEKKVWFVLHQPATASQNVLLDKIAAALNLDFTMDVYCFIVPLHEQVSLPDFYIQSPKLIMSFGVTPADLGMWMDLQTPGIKFFDRMTFILTVSLAQLEEQAGQKKELWKNMQHYLEAI